MLSDEQKKKIYEDVIGDIIGCSFEHLLDWFADATELVGHKWANENESALRDQYLATLFKEEILSRWNQIYLPPQKEEK